MSKEQKSDQIGQYTVLRRGWRDQPQETYGIERVPYYVYVDIHGAEIAELRAGIAELRETVKQLLERLEQKREQEVIPINFFESKKIKSKKSFNVTLEYYPKDNLYIVEAPELNIYGEGQDRSEAIADFRLALEETYFNLKEDQDKLGPDLAKEWLYLNEIIEENPQ